MTEQGRAERIASDLPGSSRDARLFAVAALIRLVGPVQAAALIKEANTAASEGRAPDFSLLFPSQQRRPGGSP